MEEKARAGAAGLGGVALGAHLLCAALRQPADSRRFGSRRGAAAGRRQMALARCALGFFRWGSGLPVFVLHHLLRFLPEYNPKVYKVVCA